MLDVASGVTVGDSNSDEGCSVGEEVDLDLHSSDAFVSSEIGVEVSAGSFVPSVASVFVADRDDSSQGTGCVSFTAASAADTHKSYDLNT
jgi:hypothetical protein